MQMKVWETAVIDVDMLDVFCAVNLTCDDGSVTTTLLLMMGVMGLVGVVAVECELVVSSLELVMVEDANVDDTEDEDD